MAECGISIDPSAIHLWIVPFPAQAGGDQQAAHIKTYIKVQGQWLYLTNGDTVEFYLRAWGRGPCASLQRRWKVMADRIFIDGSQTNRDAISCDAANPSAAAVSAPV
ncbi:hypothetical protein RFM98_30695 [Mesorhizobium sp. VK9D]|uniref:hypothetical protein n=1 Tax=Mesorhizobium australafricanum TaxID=3072311 RepID=UPI002A240F1D|nr:hypothetical protein [Mesorhizobium sp. VK9D]MDX8457106.1 hypothetical protein [Mesorhizobium sp. VK9D]